MSESTNQQLIRTTTKFAFTIALLTFCAIPTIYLSTAWSYERDRIQAEADSYAARIAKLVYSDPKHWRFQELRLEEMLSFNLEHLNRSQHRVLDLDGNEVISRGPQLAFPAIQSAAEIGDGGQTVATVTVRESLWPLILKTGGVTLISLTLSWAIFLALRTLPMRALKLVVSDLERSEAGLNQTNEALQKEIEERKRIEEERSRAEATTRRLARIVEDSMNEIYVFDAETLKFVQVNAAACKNLGYTMAELKELTPVDLKPDHTVDTFERLISALRSDEAKYLRFETVHRRKDATRYDVKVILQQICSEDQLVFAAIIEDITDRKRTEEQLHQAQKMEAVGQLTGGIAHDFNNMLAAIIGNLEILGDHLKGQASAKRSLDIAFRAASRAAELTHHLLAFSRRQHLESEVLDLREVLSGMGAILQTTLTESIELETHVAENLRPIWADLAQLESAIINLAINARDAMPKGGRLLIESVDVELDEAYAAQHPDVTPGSYVMLSMSDNGFGIPADVREHVFEPFFTTKEVGKGTGLGLSMIFGFVKQLGGHVTLYSEEKQGTCVRLYLPVAEASATVSSERSASKRTSPGGVETVLVVEDDTDVRETALALLQNLGYQVLLAENGPAALTLLDEHSDVDLLFTDIVMPGGMSGLDLVREVSGRIPRPKVLCTSGYSEKALTDDSKFNQRTEWIGKPYFQDDLAQKVRRVLDDPQA